MGVFGGISPHEGYYFQHTSHYEMIQIKREGCAGDITTDNGCEIIP